MAKNIYKKRFRKATLIYAGSMALFLLICVLVLGSQGMEKGRLEKQLTEVRQATLDEEGLHRFCSMASRKAMYCW